jgi:hypothetical protein
MKVARVVIQCPDVDLVLKPELAFLCSSIARDSDDDSDSDSGPRIFKDVTVKGDLTGEQLRGLTDVASSAELKAWCDGWSNSPDDLVKLFLVFDQLGLELPYIEARLANLLANRSPSELRDLWRMANDLSEARSRDLTFQLEELPKPVEPKKRKGK